MPIHITLLDLPPPSEIKSYASLGLLLIRPPPGNATIGIETGNGLTEHLRKLAHRVYRIAYYGYALPLVVIATSDYERNPFPRSAFLWSTVDRKFRPLLIPSGKFRYPQKDSKTMPRKASATPAPTTAPATKSVTAPKAVARPKINKTPEGTVTIEETRADGSPVDAAPEPEPKPEKAKKEKPAKNYPTVVPTRQEVLSMDAPREFHPMDPAIIQRAVCPEYKKILADAIANGTKCVVQVQPTKEFLLAFAKANGLNRPRKWPHANRLIREFRTNFDSSCTHYVLTIDWAVSNAGHSSIALLLAWYSADDIDQWGLGFDVASQIEPETGLILSVEGSETEDAVDANEVQNDFVEHYKQQGDFRVTLVVNAPRESLLKMDDLRLEAGDADFISGIPQLSKCREDWGIEVNQLVQIVNGLYKRTAPKSTDPKTKEPKYGTLAKGGRLNASEAPIRAMTFLPMILECTALLRSYSTSKEDIFFANNLQDENSRLSLKDVMVALCVLNGAQRKRLADLICKDSTYGKALAERMTKPANSAGWSKPSADWIVTSLVKAGMGGTTAQCVTELADESWHKEAFRAAGWDRDEIDEEGVSRQDVLNEMTQAIAEITGNADLIEKMNDKVRRQERAEKTAAGDTSRKAYAKPSPRKPAK